MHLAIVVRVMGLLLILFSSMTLVPAALALFEGTKTLDAFLGAAAITFFAGLLLLPAGAASEARVARAVDRRGGGETSATEVRHGGFRRFEQISRC